MHKLKFLLPWLLLGACAWGSNIRQVGMVDLPGAPGFDGLGFVNGMLLLSHAATGTVDIFNAKLRRLAGKVNNMAQPKGIAVDESGRAYVANSGANNIVVLAPDFQVQRTIALPFSPEKLIYVPQTKLLYVSCTSAQRLLSVDPRLGTATHVVEMQALPEDLAYDPGRQLLYVALQDQKKIQVFDSELKPVTSFDLSGALPTGIVYDRQLDRIYVAVRGAVLALDAQTGSEVGRVSAPTGVDQLWLDASSRTLFAASNGSVLTMQAGDQLSLQEQLAVDVKGHILAFDPDTSLIYIPGGEESRSKLLILKQLPPGSDAPPPAEANSQAAASTDLAAR